MKKIRTIAVITPYRKEFRQFCYDNKTEDILYIWIYDIRSAFGRMFDDYIKINGAHLLDPKIEEFVSLHIKKKKNNLHKNLFLWNRRILIFNFLILLILSILSMTEDMDLLTIISKIAMPLLIIIPIQLLSFLFINYNGTRKTN